MNDILSSYECRLSGGGPYSNPTSCNQICLNFLSHDEDERHGA